MAQTKERKDQLRGDLEAGKAGQAQVQSELDECNGDLKKAQEDVAAANNMIGGNNSLNFQIDRTVY